MRRAGGDRAPLGRAALVDDGVERGGKLVRVLRRLHRLGDIGRELAAVGLLLEEFDAVPALGGGELVEIDEHRRAVVLAGLDGERAPGRGLDREAHHGLVDRADLLDIERAVGQALAVARSVISPSRMRRMQPSETGSDPRRVGRLALAFEERKGLGIEQLAAARLDQAGAVAAVDQPEQREQPAPAAARSSMVSGLSARRRRRAWRRGRARE